MSSPRRSVPPGPLLPALARLREELDVPSAFPEGVLQAAEATVGRGPTGAHADRTDLPLVTIDPPGSMDLDQAVHVARRDGGFRVSYAIADVAAWVQPDDPIDTEAWERGVSRYSPDLVTPLHPTLLSEGAASLLPDRDRPAVLWEVDLDADGEVRRASATRATVRSRAQLTYAEAQRAVDDGRDPMLVALSQVGRLRAEREWVRGGVSLELPDQEVHLDDDGVARLVHRAPLPIEGWNAQVSLLTGIVAGTAMAEAGVGVLRTLPAPGEEVVDGLRQRAWALGLPWPREVGYGEFVRTLDPHEATEAAMIAMAAVGLRGAGYLALQGSVPPDHRHEALAAPYAHVTAPLRRLVDRYATEVALAVLAGTDPPAWALDRLDALPKAMARARGRAAALDRAVLDLVEAHVLAPHVGEVFAATVVRVSERGSDVQLRVPAVAARIDAQLPLGTEVHLRLDAADPDTRTITFTPAIST